MDGDLPFELIKPILQTHGRHRPARLGPVPAQPEAAQAAASGHRADAGRARRARHPHPAAHAEAYAAGIPGARLVDVEGAAHMLSLEKPDELSSLVREFAAG